MNENNLSSSTISKHKTQRLTRHPLSKYVTNTPRIESDIIQIPKRRDYSVEKYLIPGSKICNPHSNTSGMQISNPNVKIKMCSIQLNKCGKS